MATKRPTTPPPLHQMPTAKEKKYDRQLRLWGATGQEALEETHILLINSGPGITGVETLKNLVLPGVGNFTILDSAVVTEADLGVNFFLDDASLGKFRAQETVKMLMELNPDVKGIAITEPIESIVTQDKFFTPYTLILVAAPINTAILASIQTHAQKLVIPAFYFHSHGFYSHASVFLPPAFPIVDTHPDPDTTADLRLLKPWPALSAFAKEMTDGLDTMSVEKKGHVPYNCLLLHYLEQWKSSHDDKMPETYKEKTAFRELVRSGSGDEENYDEAVAAVLKSLNPPTPSSTVREILAAPEAKAENLNANTPSFWVIANAIQQFYSVHNELPLPGAVPDMKAQSVDYIKLQSIYKNKARSDSAEVLSFVRQIEEDTNRSPSLAIPETEIENFCKGAAHIALVRGRPFPVAQAGEKVQFGDRATAFAMELTNPDSLIATYLAFLAWDEYVATHSSSAADTGGEGLRVPGAVDSELEEDTEKVSGIAHALMDSLIKEAGAFIEDPEYSELKDTVSKVCQEMVRSGGAELHNIASLTGGMVAQEVIKVITRQYVPLDNTLVFDGVLSKTQVLRI